MIDFYSFATSNGWRAAIMLEECGIDYKLHSVNLRAGEQRNPDFLKINPNGKIPAIVDHDGNKSVTVFESGAILIYLAEKTGKFLPKDSSERAIVYEWLFWQMTGLGVMYSLLYQFEMLPTDKNPEAAKRYHDQLLKYLTVLNNHLEHQNYVAMDYSIADMAMFPTIGSLGKVKIDLANYAHIEKWYTSLKSRPAVIKGMATCL